MGRPLPTRLRGRDRRAGGGRRALSVVEILIVVTIVAIAAGVVLPMVDTVDRTRLREAARSLVADLEYAQLQSMAHAGDARLLVLDPAGAGYHVAAASDPTTPLAHPASGAPYRVRFGAGGPDSAGVSIVGRDLGGDDALGFGVWGELDQPTPARLTLAAGDLALVITVDPETGEAEVGAIE